MKNSLKHLEAYRSQQPLPSEPGSLHGCFIIPHPDKKLRERYIAQIVVIASCGSETEEGSDVPASGWDHVSAQVRWIQDAERRMCCPTWAEMCAIKEAFFDDDETVIQYHPAKADYVNTHESVLHLWKPVMLQIPTPPKIFV